MHQHIHTQFLSNKLRETLQLPNTPATFNSTKLVHDLSKLKIRDSNRLITLGKKDLYIKFTYH